MRKNKPGGMNMQNTHDAPLDETEEHPTRVKWISLAVTLLITTPLIITLVMFQWSSMGLIPLLIIVGSLLAIVIGVWHLAVQLVTVIREGGDSDFRER